MSKTDKITFNMVAAGMAQVEKIDVQITDDIHVSVVRTLGMKDAFAFVDNIASACVNVTEEKYTPETRDFAMRVSVMHWYAGVQMPSGKDMEKAYRVLYDTDVFGKVFDVIDHNQFDVLMAAADDRIEFGRDAMLSTATRSVTHLMAKMDDMISDSTEVMKQFESDDFQKAFKNVMDAMQSNASTEANAVATDDISIPARTSTDGKIVRLQRPKTKK